ncbi:MAG: 4Fe-4S dicluster domain-containing protein [Deltaproteobacteria bacterium]|nr:4Fe-4S dicluster domain-containing protein [Deltaproteobacteria bacterium]MBW2015491.1 4Fe-4S dicluster domain-containing protein [Deltaproteobacteria bacterium]MBW2128761.1 4Fe-4S dicluster domain-containing protein [Deltaproteobacteria bacterium]MBW2303911.1 4Fe-4S dicluster domain-containing protein [Deltaproteobacteria bacterium]
MIIVDVSKCSGCRRCEVHCSFYHSGKVGRSGARIKVVKVEESGIDFPVNCRLCKERYCAKCPESAIQFGRYGQVVLSTTLCTGCGTCEKLCPIGAIELFEEVPVVCDLCGGDPRCVKACTMGALSFEPEGAGKVSLEIFKKRARGKTPEEKRLDFALESVEGLREQWLKQRRG